MNQRSRLVIFCLASLTVLLFLQAVGFFKLYAYLLSKDHLHRSNLFFRAGFIAVFAAVNHWFFTPRFYQRERYSLYAALVIAGLLGMLILPEFLIKQPVFTPSVFEDIRFKTRPNFPVPIPLFEMTHMIILFFTSVFASLSIRKRQNRNSALPQTPSVEKAIVETQAVFMENPVEQKEKTNDASLNITVNYSLLRIEFSTILFIKSMDNYLQIHLKDKKPILVRMTLKEVLEKLPTNKFLRVHKSYIVSLEAIESIRNKKIFMVKQEIPIGRAYEESVFKVLVQ